MKPAQHEYEVMGLAPYGSEYHGRRSLEFFRKINQVEGTRILNTATVRDLYYSVRDALEGERFDGIAWGLQTWVEEILTQWIEANVREHNCDNVILSGGVAQNIKACKAVLEMPAVRQLWVGPIAGDGSLGIGAAWLAHKQTASTEIRGLPTTYLGTSWDKKAIAKAIGDNALADNFTMVENPEPARVAGWLADGLIMGRFSGRMEFGQRALGNRSILADPRRRENVERINQKIKRRDFWMPFTPSMLIEEADRILQNPKSSYSPFMTLAFDLKEPFANAIPAAVHSGDNSTRPQMLRREDNPAYYDLIEAFRARTGLGVVLNTSFNLHGEVIVESPEDAVSTFLRSDLDCILLENIAILRQAPK
jgi:carbamoyltransferase